MYITNHIGYSFVHKNFSICDLVCFYGYYILIVFLLYKIMDI